VHRLEELWAKAYSSSANLGPGFDILSVAHTSYYDIVSISIKKGSGNIETKKVVGPYSKYVNDKNSALIAIENLINELKINNYDISLKIWKGIPVSSGLGGSGASASAAVYGLTKLLDLELSIGEMIRFAGYGETASAGVPHYDNVSASMLGGFVVVGNIENKIHVYKFNVNAKFLIFKPEVPFIENKTKKMRSLLPLNVSFEDHVKDLSNMALLISSLLNNDLKTAGKAMNDIIVTNSRAKAIPCFNDLKKNLIENGAYGVAISGAGPSIISLIDQNKAGELIEIGLKTYEKFGIKADAKISEPAPGVSILDTDYRSFPELA
jgi:homoserine kinase